MATDGTNPGIVRVDEQDKLSGANDALVITGVPRLSSGKEEELLGLLHDLNNVLVCVLLNAQIMALRLPSYSVLKRNVYEVERSAQQGGLFVRRLRNWYQAAKDAAAG